MAVDAKEIAESMRHGVRRLEHIEEEMDGCRKEIEWLRHENTKLELQANESQLEHAAVIREVWFFSSHPLAIMSCKHRCSCKGTT